MTYKIESKRQKMAFVSKGKLNSTGSMSIEFTEEGILLMKSYNTVVGYSFKNKTVIVDTFYSTTTSSHLRNFRDMFGVEREDTFEYRAFIKRAELDGVNVKGGMNG